MGHKVHPKAHRMQVIYTWDSRWFGKKKMYAKLTEQDIKIREFLLEKFKDALVDSIAIERSQKHMTITILAAKPGMVIGRGAQGLDDVRRQIERQFLNMAYKTKINVMEVASPSLSAAIVAQGIVSDIERRLPFRRSMKSSIERVLKAGGKGVKVRLSGRLNGAEIARTEKLAAGSVPLITLRSDVDYALAEAQTLQGKIGVKVWIYHGEIFGRKDKFLKVADEHASDDKKKR